MSTSVRECQKVHVFRKISLQVDWYKYDCHVKKVN